MVNEGVNVDRTRAFWSIEETRVVAQEEARTEMNGGASKNIHVCLMQFLGASGSLSVYHSTWTRQGYKDLAKAAVDDLTANSEFTPCLAANRAYV